MDSDETAYRYVIVGAGIAGLSATRAILESDRSGGILLISDEDRLPYKRTKISKNIAAGFERDTFALERKEWYEENRVELLCGDSVIGIEPNRQRIELRSGRFVRWEKLILATGAAPIRPPDAAGSDGQAVFVVRTAEEVERLREAILPKRRAVVVGNGVLGVEVAEQLRLLGKEVTLIGRAHRPLARRLNEELSEMLENLLIKNGIEVIGDSHIETIVPTDATDGKGTESFSVMAPEGRLETDMVVYCGGVSPNMEAAIEAGIRTDRGILVDEYLRTSEANIFAAGDVAQHAGGYVSFLWHAAELQGRIAGSNAAGGSVRHDCPPFRLKCEVFGNYFFSLNPPGRDDGYEIVEERNEGRYRCLYYRGGVVAGVLMANEKERAKSYVQAVREGWTPDKVAEALPFSTSTQNIFSSTSSIDSTA